MQMQDKEATQATTSIQKSRRASWLTGLGVLVLVTLLVSLGATAFAYWHVSQRGTTATQAATWQRVLNGYTLVSLTAAPSNPAVLYACGVPFQPSTPVPYRPSQPTQSYTLLRSTDSGTTWQRVTNLVADCQLAINPAQSDDLYMVGLAGHIASNGEVPTVLRHSTDGGRSWTDIAPTPNTGNPQLALSWDVHQLTMVGNHLFGIQLLPSAGLQPIIKPSPAGIVTRLDLFRLVESSDGGYTWTIIDDNLNVTGQGTYDYIVSPSDAQTIYALVGSPGFPYRIPSTLKTLPTYGSNLTLYKTTNGGGTWTKLLENVLYGSTVQIANKNPSLVFVGSSMSIMPFKGYDIGQDVSPQFFSLRESKDGGATWLTVEAPPGGSLVQNWFVSADGQMYIATGTAVSGQPTGTIGTIVPVGTNQIQPVGNSVTINQRIPKGNVIAIQRYDAASGTWSTITKTPSSGTLLAVTAGATVHKATLWFLSSDENAQALYRETL